ncbi:acid protease [Schizopora paradoxa]|uniref:Acid protease n=1 Tax=Schizopora paradoxa TaxID=27342 RepID=A0A0H2RLY7_9AGAM|nr:acid protease [Schizopora paradoxa]
MLTSTLISILSLALAASAGPIVVRDNLIRIPLTKKINLTEPAQLVKQDQARASFLRSLGGLAAGSLERERAVHSVAVQNQATSYVADVEIGTPPTSYSLLIDTGSSNTWVGAGKAYKHTSSTQKTHNKVSVTYGSGSFSGDEYHDTVTLGRGLTIKQQSIGVATKAEGFDSIDGILGIGPADLTVGTLSPDSHATIPTVTDKLFHEGIIPHNEVAISFEPTTSAENKNGEMTFGGVDHTKFTGEITYAPITSTSPASDFWGIDQSIRYGASTNILSETAGIVDTGTTLTLIATDAFQRYQRATGGVMDSATGLLKITPAQFANLKSLFFKINGVDFEFTANAQIWPRALNSEIGGTADGIYLIVSDNGSQSGEGLDFINGMSFLERFYSVYDTSNSRVGIAYTPHTYDLTN